jgi:putative ABC transport system permease protein
VPWIAKWPSSPTSATPSAWGVIAFTTTVCLATGLLFRLAPALQTMSVGPQDVLRDAGARTAGTSGAHVTRAALVIAQVAMALMLVAAAALMVTSFNRLQAVDPGFRTEQVLSVGLSLPPARYPAPARQHQFYQQVLERLQATPIASSSALVFPMPLRASSAQAIFDIDGRKTAPGQPKPTAAIASIAPGYFRTLSVPILQGRDITAQDTDTAPPVAIVSTTFAAKYWPNENPLGKRLQFDDEGGEAVTVVGLVGDIRGYGLDREAPPTLYFPYQQFTIPTPASSCAPPRGPAMWRPRSATSSIRSIPSCPSMTSSRSTPRSAKPSRSPGFRRCC